MKKDLIEIVTPDRIYYVKENYEEVKNELKYSGYNCWVSFSEVYKLKGSSCDGFAKSNREKLFLNINHIISINKLYEWGAES